MEYRWKNKQELMDRLKRGDCYGDVELNNISKELLQDYDVIAEVIKRRDLKFINVFSDKMKNDRKLMEIVIDRIGPGEFFHWLSPELKNDKEFVLKLASVDPNVQYGSGVGDKLRKDEDFCKLIKEISSPEKTEEEKDQIILHETSKEYLEQISKIYNVSELTKFYNGGIRSTYMLEGLNQSDEFAKRRQELIKQKFNEQVDKICSLEVLPRSNYNSFDEDFFNLIKGASEDTKRNVVAYLPQHLGEYVGLKDSFKCSDDEVKKMVGENLYDESYNYSLIMGYMRKILLDENGNLFKECVSKLNENTDLSHTERLSGLKKLLKSFNSNDYKVFLKSIDINNINIGKLNNILSQPNYFNIKNQNDFNNFDTIKENVCDSIIKGDTETIKNYQRIQDIDKKDLSKFATLEKLFGFDLEDAQKVADKFVEIDEIKAEDNEELKKYVQSIIAIKEETNEDKFREIYTLKPASEFLHNKELFNQKVKAMYTKEYESTLFNANNANIIENNDMKQYFDSNANLDGVKFLDAGTDFNMIVHSLSAYNSSGKDEQTDYAKSWNRDIAYHAQEVSCSYIGNDMLGTAEVHTLCYGFDKMGKNSLEMASEHNLGIRPRSDSLEWEIITNKNDKFLPPQTMKDKTDYYHNEMLFSRVQDGERKQPSYIVLFKRENKIDEEIANNALQAVNDFKKMGRELPIVVIDVDRCVEHENVKIDNMIETALENSDLDLIHKAGQKMRNVGVATTESNDELGIKNDRYKKALETIQAKFEQIKGNFKVGIETFKNAYQKTNVEERKNEVSDIAKVYSIMSRDTQEMDR